MIQTQLKLRLNVTQETVLNGWLFMLTGVWNWAIRKIEHDAQGEVYYSKQTFQNLLAGHGKPRLKGMRNKLNSIPFPDPLRAIEGNRVKLPGIGSLRFHKQDIPAGKIKCGRIIKRASGWYLCLFIDAERASITSTGRGAIGIDPGFIDLLTLSDGEKIPHPKELQRSLERLGQAQRGGNRKLAARINERIKNKRTDRNHNTHYLDVNSRNSTRICSACGCLSGPTGRAGLSVRTWEYAACGTPHDRDINAAINTLIAGVGTTLEGGLHAA